MNELCYVRPGTTAEALEALARYGAGARILNGGTDLIVRFQKGHVMPDAIVDIKGVRDIGDSIDWSNENVTVGARVVMSRIVRDERMLREYPALVEAAATVGSVQIRNRATLAGNICNASPAADTVPPLSVYGASVRLVGPAGTRVVPLETFFLGPGKTVRSPQEILTAVVIPRNTMPFGAAFDRVTRRHGVDLASINVAIGVDRDATVTATFGAVGPTPITARDSSGRLADPDFSDEERDRMLTALIAETKPISDVRATAEYRSAMLLVLARRVLTRAMQRYSRSVGEE